LYAPTPPGHARVAEVVASNEIGSKFAANSTVLWVPFKWFDESVGPDEEPFVYATFSTEVTGRGGAEGFLVGKNGPTGDKMT